MSTALTVFENQHAAVLVDPNGVPLGTATNPLMTAGTGYNLVATIAGANASGGAVSTALSGVAIGDKVLAVIGLVGTGAGVNESSYFESTISVSGHIAQTGANLSATTALLVFVLKLS